MTVTRLRTENPDHTPLNPSGNKLAAPLAGGLGSARTESVDTGRWTSDHRDVEVPPSDAARLLVVPESANPGWIARSGDGAALTAVTVDGWQQGWVLPAGRHAELYLGCGVPGRADRRPRAAGLLSVVAVAVSAVPFWAKPPDHQAPPDDSTSAAALPM